MRPMLRAAPENSVAHLVCAEPARPPHASLPAALEAAAEVDAPYLVVHGAEEPTPLGARAALNGARRWARALYAEGVRRGDRVPILLPTSASFVEAFLGVSWLGAVPVPLSSPLTFGKADRYVEHLAAVVDDARAHCLVTTERFEAVAARVDRLRARLRSVLTPERAADPTGPPAPTGSFDGDQVALLQYTSGTTGRPKGVTISQRALTSNASAIAQGLRLEPLDVGFSWLPLFHDMGLIGSVITPLCHPFEVHVLAPEAFIMRPDRWLRLISELGATISPAPNFAYELCTRRIPHLHGMQLDGWRAALNGAEAVHASTMRRFSERFSSVGFQERAMTPVYGLAESTLAVTMPSPGAASTVRVDAETLARGRILRASGDTARELVSVGTPVAGTSICVTDERGRTVSEGEVGEIRVSGPSLMDGYFANHRASAEVLDGGWLRTGDLGAVIDGSLFVVGRAKDVVVQAGRNVYPDDIERVAREVPGVRGGAVAFGVEDPARGTESLVVMVEVVASGRGDRTALAKQVRGELLTVLGVRADDVVLCPLGSLARTTSGKIQRGACKAAFEAAQ